MEAFRKGKLGELDVDRVPEWNKHLKVEAVRSGCDLNHTGQSVEDEVKEREADVVKAREDCNRFKVIKAIDAAARTREEKTELSLLSSASVLADFLTNATNWLETSRAKKEKSEKACAALDKVIEDTVCKALYDKYLSAVAGKPGNRNAQVQEGIKVINAAMKVATREVASKLTKLVMRVQLGGRAKSMNEVAEKINYINEIKEKSKGMAIAFGEQDLVTDILLIDTVMEVTRSDKGNDIPAEVQAVINATKLKPTLPPWEEFKEEIMRIIKTLQISDGKEPKEKKSEKEEGELQAFNAKDGGGEEETKTHDYGKETHGSGQSRFPHNDGGNLDYRAYQAAVQFGMSLGQGNAAGRGGGGGRGGRGDPGGGRGGRGGRGDPVGGRGGRGGRGNDVCFAWAESGKCKRGNQCNFSHGNGGGGRTTSPRPQAFAATTNNGVCYKWANTGKCDWGDNCRFEHHAPAERGQVASRPGSPAPGDKRKAT